MIAVPTPEENHAEILLLRAAMKPVHEFAAAWREQQSGPAGNVQILAAVQDLGSTVQDLGGDVQGLGTRVGAVETALPERQWSNAKLAGWLTGATASSAPLGAIAVVLLERLVGL